MPRKVLVIAAISVLALVAAPIALADLCYITGGTLSPNGWLQTGYSYTNRSAWVGESGKGYTAERIDSGGIIRYYQDMSNGGEHLYVGGSSPWRKTSLYNWNNTHTVSLGQANDYGSCF